MVVTSPAWRALMRSAVGLEHLRRGRRRRRHCGARHRSAAARCSPAPFDPGPAGRTAFCRDPAGADFRLWQAGRRLGAQAVNEPGTWNFSNLETDRPDTAGFYADLFGWSIEDLGYATMVRRPGYGDHLEATVDPDIRARQRSGGAPPGFEDAIAFVVPLEPDMRPHWHVAFSVADRDAAVNSAPAPGRPACCRRRGHAGGRGRR